MGKISRLFSKANAQNGYNAAEKALNAVEKIDKIYVNYPQIQFAGSSLMRTRTGKQPKTRKLCQRFSRAER